jgi:predicted Rossmann fold nucleotide-binding protein DprA/Smf involved in DNA uptake
VTEIKDLPREAQEVLSKVNTEFKTVFRLVEELGWNQTEVQKWINALDAAGWLESKTVIDGHPAGGSATAYKRKVASAPSG